MKGIRSVRRGHSPNCSATGSFVGAALLSAAAVAAVLNAFAARVFRPSEHPSRIRPEADGAILQTTDPPALIFLDKEAAAALGVVPIDGPRTR